VSPVKYELDFHIPEDGILHSHRPENARSYTAVTISLKFHFFISYVSISLRVMLQFASLVGIIA
jgi:hypothetical protein